MAEPKRRGRWGRSELARIMLAFRGGVLTDKHACELAGVSYSGFYRRMQRDERFAKAIRAIKARRLALVEDALFQAAVTPSAKGWTSANVQAQEVLLSRRAPAEWAMRREQPLDDTVDADVRERAGALSKVEADALRKQAPEAILGPGTAEEQ